MPRSLQDWAGQAGQGLSLQQKPQHVAVELVSAAEMVLALFPAVSGALVPVARPVQGEPP